MRWTSENAAFSSFKQAPAYATYLGQAYCGDSRRLLAQIPDNTVNLIITSPPFALQRKKEYGNKDQAEYIDWLTDFAILIYRKLKPDGSFVLDLGGAYQKGSPTRSLYNFRVPIRLCDEVGFFLAEDFYWYNPSKLPSPIEWVNKRKIRAKDSVNNLWWFSKTEWPKANISNVLTPYSTRMEKLLENPKAFYTPKARPSGHEIGNSFGKDNGGAIPSNLLQIPNSESNGPYLAGCKLLGLKQHPARFPSKLPEFFIRFLTEPGDLVIDPFAGSNTTGAVAESEGRRWLAFEERIDYVATSVFRLLGKDCKPEDMRHVYEKIMNGETPRIDEFKRQQELSFTGTKKPDTDAQIST